ANLRPVSAPTLPALQAGGVLRPEIAAGADFIIVRELTGGMYFGDKQEGVERAVDVCVYTRAEVARVTRAACTLARGRRKQVVSVDKANVLATSRLSRAVVTELVADEFPDLELRHMLVDACAMHLLRRPT